MTRLLCAIALFFSTAAYAQSVAVTATVTDADGQLWANGTWSARIVLPSGTFRNVLPTSGGSTIIYNTSGVISASGVISTSLARTDTIDQAGAQWDIQACPNVSAVQTNGCFDIVTVITGAIDLSARFSGIPAPRIPAGPNSFAYSDAEVTTPSNPGLSYFNTGSNPNTAGLRLWDGKRWVSVAAGGGGTTGTPFHIAAYSNTGAQTQTNYTTDATGNPLAVPGLITSLSQSVAGTSSTCTINDVDTNSQNCTLTTGLFNNPPAPLGSFSGTAQRTQRDIVNSFGPGFYYGGHFGWNTLKALELTVNGYQPAITQALSVSLNCHSVGDCANYIYANSDGQGLYNADEGLEGLGVQSLEQPNYYRGTITATSGTGDTAITPSAPSGNYSNAPTVGWIIEDVTKASATFQLTGVSATFNGGHDVILTTTGNPLPVTSAWATLPALCKPNTKSNVSAPATVCSSGSTTIPATPGVYNGTTSASLHTGSACFFGGTNFFEQALITVSGTGSSQTISVSLRYPYEATGGGDTPIVAQDGPCGTFISSTANLALSGMRSSYPAPMALDSTHLLAFKPVQGSASPYLPQYQAEAWQPSGSNSAFNLIPGAEVVVADRNTADTTFQNLPQLAYNTVPWAVGDNIEAPHPVTQLHNTLFLYDYQNSPTDRSLGGSAIQIGMTAPGISGNHNGISMSNFNPISIYVSGGGPLAAPRALQFGGAYDVGGLFSSIPASSLFDFNRCREPGDTTSTTANIPLFNMPNLTANHAATFTYNCSTQMFATQTFNAVSLLSNGVAVCDKNGNNCPTSASYVALSGTLPYQSATVPQFSARGVNANGDTSPGDFLVQGSGDSGSSGFEIKNDYNGSGGGIGINLTHSVSVNGTVPWYFANAGGVKFQNPSGSLFATVLNGIYQGLGVIAPVYSTGVSANTDTAGTVNLASGATTSPAVTFTGTYANPPVCQFFTQNATATQAAALGTIATQVTNTTASAIVSTAPASAITLGYHCIGRN